MRITDKDRIEVCYEALINRDQSFVGTFFVGVKTTSVFCISTCRARKPKKENVEFYTTFKAAMDNGYRPCKVCKPTENSSEAPLPVEKAIQMVKSSPKKKITDQDLRESGVAPEMVRRWFKSNYNMTFQAYQRMYRVNSAYQELKLGKSTTSTAYESGYDSLSGFGYTFKKLTGTPPSKRDEQNIILIDRLTTPIGPMFVCATDKGVCLLEFVDRKMLETEFKDIQRLLKARIINGENHHINQAKQQIAEYFNGERTSFDLQLDTPGTEFQNTVWKALSGIEFGHTATYQSQAERIRKPTAVRAVASANGMNRIAIIVPCHRVIGKDGSLTGYGGGLERKRWLLDHERRYFNGTMH